MKIILSTESIFSAARLKSKIIKAVEGQNDELSIETWSYLKSSDGFDIIYHNPSQYTEDPFKNVIFRVELDGENVVFSCARWSKNPLPSEEMNCLHTGRLTEMLLTYFSKDINKFSIVGF